VTVLRSGSATDVGRIRKVNQDLPLERSNLYAVADGMGGHAGGEVAAKVAVETLEHVFERIPTAAGLLAAFNEANQEVWRQSQTDVELRGMGTTLTAMALVGGAGGYDTLALANVGDSRAYVFSGGTLTQVTEDHSLAEERMRHGEMTEAEAAVHPQRHILTRALGVSSEVETDMWELELHTGDRVLICSDGLSNEVGLEEMAAVLSELDDPAEASQRLVEVANEHGGADNITVVVVDVQIAEHGHGSVPVVTPLTSSAAFLSTAGTSAAAAAAAAAAANGTADVRADAGDTDAAVDDGTAPSDQPKSDATVSPSSTSDVDSDSASASAAAGSVSAVADEVSGPLAPGAHLSFGSGDGTMLAESGPRSGEFFLGNAAAAPVARSTTRVPLAAAPVAAPAAAAAVAGTATAATETKEDESKQKETKRKEKKEWETKEKKESRGARRRRLGIPRRITPRVIGFLLLICAVPVAAYFVLRWYAYDNYFVTVQGDQIVVKQGQPGGVLWFHPRVVDHTHVTTSQILPAAVPTVRAGVEESSLAAARNYIANLQAAATSSTASTTTTTTTGGVGASTSTAPVPAGSAP
jgi:protein phosphatase